MPAFPSSSTNQQDSSGNINSNQLVNQQLSTAQTRMPSTPSSSESRQPEANGLFGWLRTSFSPQPETRSIEPGLTRPRRDSSTMSADEALNISRANSTKPIPIRIPESSYESAAAASMPSSVGNRKRRNSSKYDSLGLITAFSGGPGSF